MPTWNYVSVLCAGDVRQLETDELVKQLDDLSEFFEMQLLPKPVWMPAKMEDGKFETMLCAIVGFKMRVTSLRGTTKLHQNISPDIRKKVIATRDILEDNSIASAMANLEGYTHIIMKWLAQYLQHRFRRSCA